MGRPPSCDCHCECFEGPFILDSWIGSRSNIPLDLTQYDNWPQVQTDANRQLLWAIRIAGTGDLADGTTLCVYDVNGAIRSAIAPDLGNLQSLMPMLAGTVVANRIRNNFVITKHRFALSTAGGCFAGWNYDGQFAVATFGDDSATCPTSINVATSMPIRFNLELWCFTCNMTPAEFPNLWDRIQTNNELSNYPNNNVTFLDISSPHSAVHLDDFCCDESDVDSPNSNCEPDVVAMTCERLVGTVVNGYRSHILDIDRLQNFYGNVFSFWRSNWYNTADELSIWLYGDGLGNLTTGFHRYRLDRAKVLWLGSMRTVNDPDPFPSYAHTFPFASGSLDQLKEWLDSGDKLLVADGGVWPEQFFGTLGLDCSIETIGGPTFTRPSLNWDQHPFYDGPPTDSFFPKQSLPVPSQVRIEAQSHPLTDGVTGSLAVINYTITGGYRYYTTVAPVVTPSTDGIVIGRVRGHIEDVDVDYPAMVLEPWPGNPTSHVLVHSIGSPAASPYPHPIQYNVGLSWIGSQKFIQNLWDKLDDF